MERVLRDSTDNIRVRGLRQPHVFGQILVVILRILGIFLSLTYKFRQNFRELVKLLLYRPLIPGVLMIGRILDHRLHAFNHPVPGVQLNFQSLDPLMMAIVLVIFININILGV